MELYEYENENLVETYLLFQISTDRKFKTADVPTGVLKGAPDFCTVYVVAKGKVSSIRSASTSLPNQPLLPVQNQSNNTPGQPDIRAVQGTRPQGQVLQLCHKVITDESSSEKQKRN